MFRVGFIYILVAALLVSPVFKSSMEKSRRKVLDRLLPGSFDLLWQPQESVTDKTAFNKHINYYRKVIAYMPQSPEIAHAHAVLGFCLYQQKDIHQALKHYQLAHQKAPQFFWYAYNLGLIYFQKSEYQKAVEVLTQAVNLNPELTLMQLEHSKIYHQIRLLLSEEKNTAKQLKEGYRQAHQMMILSLEKLGRFDQMFIQAQMLDSLGLNQDEIFTFYQGKAAVRLNQFLPAFNYLKEYLKRYPQDSEALMMMSLALKGLGQQEMAERLAQQAQPGQKTGDVFGAQDHHFTLRVF